MSFMKTDILTEIVTYKRLEVQAQKAVVPYAQLERLVDETASALSLSHALTGSDTGIIAEFKRRSPSKGWFGQEADVATVVTGYVQAGAAGLSVLTDEAYFGGTLADLRRARPLAEVPVLRKDFIVEPYQVLQAKAVGADAILLIAAALTPTECRALGRLAHELRMEVLLELHGEDELDYVDDYADMVGVNNRHLGTFHTDVEHSFRLVSRLPKDKVLVSESGISQPQTVRSLREAGFRGFLMGEAFMKTDNPGTALSGFIKQLRP